MRWAEQGAQNAGRAGVGSENGKVRQREEGNRGVAQRVAGERVFYMKDKRRMGVQKFRTPMHVQT